MAKTETRLDDGRNDSIITVGGAFFALSFILWYPLLLLAMICYGLYIKVPAKKNLILGIFIFSYLYLGTVGTGYHFGNYVETLHDEYQHSPRILYPFTVPFYLGVRLKQDKIGNSVLSEREARLDQVETKFIKANAQYYYYTKLKNPNVPNNTETIKVRVTEQFWPDQKDCHVQGTNYSCDMPYVREELVGKEDPMNPLQWSKTMYPVYLILNAAHWLGQSQAEEEAALNKRVNKIVQFIIDDTRSQLAHNKCQGPEQKNCIDPKFIGVFEDLPDNNFLALQREVRDLIK